MAIQVKNSRIDIRLDPKDKETLEYAASLKRISLSSYILSAAIEMARKDIEKEGAVILSNQQRDELLKLLDNPPELTEALRKLFQ